LGCPYRQNNEHATAYLQTTDPGPVPLAQTSDDKCKVMTFKDGEGGSSTDFTLGHQWELRGRNGCDHHRERRHPAGRSSGAICILF